MFGNLDLFGNLDISGNLDLFCSLDMFGNGYGDFIQSGIILYFYPRIVIIEELYFLFDDVPNIHSG